MMSSDHPATLDLSSMYMTHPVLGAHRLALRVEATGGDYVGELFRDPNTCTLDDFGGPSGCTRMAVQQTPIKLVRTRTADPAGRGRSIFRAEHDGARLKLILDRETGIQHLVIVDGESTAVAPLFSSAALQPR